MILGIRWKDEDSGTVRACPRCSGQLGILISAGLARLVHLPPGCGNAQSAQPRSETKVPRGVLTARGRAKSRRIGPLALCCARDGGCKPARKTLLISKHLRLLRSSSRCQSLILAPTRPPILADRPMVQWVPALASASDYFPTETHAFLGGAGLGLTGLNPGSAWQHIGGTL